MNLNSPHGMLGIFKHGHGLSRERKNTRGQKQPAADLHQLPPTWTPAQVPLSKAHSLKEEGEHAGTLLLPCGIINFLFLI